MRKFLKRFHLRPYGDSLLTPSADSWIFFVRILILGMALTEALSWGYVGRFLIPGSWLAAGLVGIVIFFFVWGIDTSLMTLDRNERTTNKKRTTSLKTGSKDTEENPPPEEGEPIEGITVQRASGQKPMTWMSLYEVWNSLSKLLTGVTVRFGLISASLIITAPFIALIVFEKDIDRRIAENYAEKVSEQTVKIRERAKLEQEDRKKALDGLITDEQTAKDLLKTREDELNDEMTNPKTRGFGPIARQLSNQVNLAREQRVKAQGALAKARENYETATDAEVELQQLNKAIADKNFDLLSSRWKIIADPNSYRVRNAIIDSEFVPTPEYKKAELAIQSFLGFLFIGLALMKIYEPQATRVYFNAAVQEDWIRYKVGAFDKHLRIDEKSTTQPNSMTPFHFAAFVMTELPKILARTNSEIEMSQKREDMASGQSELSDLLKANRQLFSEKQSRESMIAATNTTLDSIKHQATLVLRRKQSLALELEDIAKQEQQHHDGVNGNSSPAYLKMAAKVLESIGKDKVRLTDEHSKLIKQEEDFFIQIAQAQQSIAAEQSRLETINNRLRELTNLEQAAMQATIRGIRRKFND